MRGAVAGTGKDEDLANATARLRQIPRRPHRVPIVVARHEQDRARAVLLDRLVEAKPAVVERGRQEREADDGRIVGRGQCGERGAN